MSLDKNIMEMLIRNAQREGVEVDPWDLDLLRRWMNQAVKRGTDGIKIVVGPEPDSWIVRIYGDFER